MANAAVLSASARATGTASWGARSTWTGCSPGGAAAVGNPRGRAPLACHNTPTRLLLPPDVDEGAAVRTRSSKMMEESGIRGQCGVVAGCGARGPADRVACARWREHVGSGGVAGIAMFVKDLSQRLLGLPLVIEALCAAAVPCSLAVPPLCLAVSLYGRRCVILIALIRWVGKALEPQA